MSDNNHPITPPPELMQQWWEGTHGALYEFEAVATQAALAEPEPDPFDVAQRQLDKLAGDEEMVIYRWSDNCWCIDHTNPSNAVKLGENNGEYESTGSSLREAVINLKAILPNHLLD